MLRETATASRLRQSGWLLLLGILAIPAILVAWTRLTRDPATAYLPADGPGGWIRPDRPFSIFAHRNVPETITEYEVEVEVAQPVDKARLSWRALRAARIEWDGALIHAPAGPEALQHWRTPQEVALPSPISAGTHRLRITVLNQLGPALLQAQFDGLPIVTGSDWRARDLSGEWLPAVPVDQPWPPALARQLPPVSTVFREHAGAIGGLALVSLLFVLVISRIARSESRLFRPATLRSILLGLWVLLLLNNNWRAPVHLGFDSRGHAEYIEHILTQQRLPLATDGWQMFQSPLFHVLGALVYAAVSPLLTVHASWTLVRLIPLVCGLLQVELCYRALTIVFPYRPLAQCAGLLVGGLLPMNLYFSHGISNEPLAGLLTAGVVLGLLSALAGNPGVVSTRWQFALGGLWGAALLAKVTPVLLFPGLIVVLVVALRRQQQSWRAVIAAAVRVLLAALLVCGWYYARNWILLGQPFVGGWDPVRGLVWWQDPGFRIAGHFTSFGEALRYPIFAAHAGFWDSLYSTMWVDGFLMGKPWDLRPPWNYTPLLISTWLGLLPLSLIVVGAIRPLAAARCPQDLALGFCVATLGVYLAAMLSLYLRVPIYSTAKATYLLGLLPCVAVLAAGGFDLLARHRVSRVLLLMGLASWAACVYGSYFIVAANPG